MKKFLIILSIIILLVGGAYYTYYSVMMKVHSESNPNSYKRRIEDKATKTPKQVQKSASITNIKKSVAEESHDAKPLLSEQELQLLNANQDATQKQIVNEFDIDLIPDAPSQN